MELDMWNCRGCLILHNVYHSVMKVCEVTGCSKTVVSTERPNWPLFFGACASSMLIVVEII